MVPLRTIEIRTRKTSVFDTAMIDETAVIPVVMAKKETVSFPVARKKTRNTTRKSS